MSFLGFFSVLVSGGFIAKEVSETEATPQPELGAAKEPRQLMNQEELAEYLGISVKDSILLGPMSYGDGWTESEVPVIQIGRMNYYARLAVNEWLRNYVGIISITE